MIMNDEAFVKVINGLEKGLRNGGSKLNTMWEGYDKVGNVIKKERSIQRSLMLSYCMVYKSFYEVKNALEIGIEKNMFVCRALGLPFNSWITIDKLPKVGGRKADKVMDFVENDIPDDFKFDFVICASVLEHVFDIHKGFARTFDLCKSGGVVFFSTPFLYKAHLRPEDYWRLTPHAYDKIIPQYASDYLILEENYQGKLWGVSCFARKK